METLIVIHIIVMALSMILCTIINCCFKGNTPDLNRHNDYGEYQSPYVSLKKDCKHTGEKSLVVVSTLVTCETVQTICNDCGYILKTETDC